MMDDAGELDWNHRVADIRERRRVQRRASDADRAIISRIFGGAACRSLVASYEIQPLAPGRYRMAGEVEALVEQTCGVTLEPVEQVISETFNVEFRAGTRRDAELEPDFDALGDDEPELIEHGEIRAGRFICEVVASVIDPFPRAEDAELDQTEAGHAAPAAHPFAGLQQLKERTKPG